MDKKDLYKIIGTNIQAERKKQGFTQESFAALMNVSWSYVAKLESGTCNLTIGKIYELAQYLKIDIKILLNIDL